MYYSSSIQLQHGITKYPSYVSVCRRNPEQSVWHGALCCQDGRTPTHRRSHFTLIARRWPSAAEDAHLYTRLYTHIHIGAHMPMLSCLHSTTNTTTTRSASCCCGCISSKQMAKREKNPKGNPFRKRKKSALYTQNSVLYNYCTTFRTTTVY